MKLRRYISSDLPDIAALFRDTILKINVKDYSQEQVHIWSGRWQALMERDAWFHAMYTLVAVNGSRLVGYGNVDDTGYIDHLYVRWDCQRQGIASGILQALEIRCRELSLSAATVHASITAKPFFEKHGYKVIREQLVELCGAMFINYAMSKELTAGKAAASSVYN